MYAFDVTGDDRAVRLERRARALMAKAGRERSARAHHYRSWAVELERRAAELRLDSDRRPVDRIRATA